MSFAIVCSFTDRPAAEAAIEQLRRHGIARYRIRLHENAPAVTNAAAIETDELVTGGFVTNLVDLFNHLLDHPTPADRASTYADVVQSEGTIVSVRADDAEEARRCEELVRRAGAIRASTLPGRDADVEASPPRSRQSGAD